MTHGSKPRGSEKRKMRITRVKFKSSSILLGLVCLRRRINPPAANSASVGGRTFCTKVRNAQKEALARCDEQRARHYEHIKESARRSDRYGKGAKEVAARTVLKSARKRSSTGAARLNREGQCTQHC